MVEFTDEGEFVSAVELTGFEDTEGLCHLGGDRFAIAEERKMRITLVEIPRGTTEIDNDGRRFDLDEKAKKNKGLEGLRIVLTQKIRLPDAAWTHRSSSVTRALTDVAEMSSGLFPN